MNRKNKYFEKRPLLPGFEAGIYERQPAYNREELAESLPQVQRRISEQEESIRRSNHVNIRLSDADLAQLQKLSLKEGLPIKSMIASIVHKYITGELVEPDFSPGGFARAPRHGALNENERNKD
jgi:predicted DNA binding CopG/RHH family protein